ncbi:DUF1836 domain-containing protein [Clostridium sp.]|uniref:DUF1836 domain-containing protein n=1 Tax=Clostridium sp. TaxID=1506 RepID=UPI00261C4D75|nr:DUF1836 domain-containing protein [Clostridium sp.]
MEKISSDEISNFHCPRFNELPTVPLYKEQVIIYIEEILRSISFAYNQKILTPTMINNYVKQKVVYPPKDKKYDNKHIAYLIVVCVLKQILTIQEICQLINKQIEICEIEEAYNLFCSELETAMVSVFKTRDFSKVNSNKKTSLETEVLRSAVMSFAHKIGIQFYLQKI